jgi:5-methylcytosine-specific restriction endonuclease McrA
MKTIREMHAEALVLSKKHQLSEKEMLDHLMEMERRNAFKELGYTGIWNYCIQHLKYSEGQATLFSRIAQKSKTIPELKQAIDNNVISPSQAGRILKVIEPETQAKWINMASTMKQKELVQEVAAAKPSAVRERVRPVSETRHELRMSIPNNLLKKLDRARGLAKKASLEAMLEELLDVYLERKDPVKKAERTYLRQVRTTTAKKTMPAQVKHQVNLRDRGKCQAPGCENERYVEIHHIVPRAQGGPHTLENLTTLCSAHHQITHFQRSSRGTPYAPLQG